MGQRLTRGITIRRPHREVAGFVTDPHRFLPVIPGFARFTFVGAAAEGGEEWDVFLDVGTLHVGGRVLTERGYAREMIETIQSHADYMGIPRDTAMKRAIYACDELTGFIGACVKVRPSKKIEDLPVSSVVKRLKDKAFARSVDRAYVYGGAEALGLPLEEHIGFVIDALKPIAGEIGL